MTLTRKLVKCVVPLQVKAKDKAVCCFYIIRNFHFICL